jgi:hypothetical protein
VTLVEQMWARLDSIMDEIQLLPDTTEMDPEAYNEAQLFEANLKGKARGVAEMIAIFMQPHFADANEVAREAKRRADARARQDAEYETKGLGQRRFEGPTGDEVDKYKREPRRKPKLPVSLEDAQKIRKGFGTFETDMLAKAFKITPAQVEEIAKMPEEALTS